MLSKKKLIRQLLLATWTCLLLIIFTVPAFNHLISAAAFQGYQDSTAVQVSFGTLLDSALEDAKSAAIAQGLSGDSRVSYVAVMSEQNVVPNSPTTNARGAVGAVLVGDRLVVRGHFGSLSSAMRDYATDPVNPPNTSITSAFHIHQGDSTENGPFQYALNVSLDNTGRGGSATGEFTLTAEQIQALQMGNLYTDLHTTKNRGGELRGILMPY